MDEEFNFLKGKEILFGYQLDEAEKIVKDLLAATCLKKIILTRKRVRLSLLNLRL